jgi:hypothetical protein
LIEVLHELGAVRMFLESWQLTNQGFGPLLYLSHEVQLTWWTLLKYFRCHVNFIFQRRWLVFSFLITLHLA